MTCVCVTCGWVCVCARAPACLAGWLAGAELANLVNEALLLTARHGKEEVELTELLEGLSRTK